MFMYLPGLLLKARKDKGITQNELAKKLGWSSSQFVSNWERRMCSAPVEKWPKIAKLLDLDMSEIVKAAKKRL